MEFLKSDRDVLDAFKLRILTDDKYVMDCLMECGLDNAINNSRYARQFVLRDFRTFYTAIRNPETAEVTDTFKHFVDEKGRYRRDTFKNGEEIKEHSIVLEPRSDQGYDVYVYTEERERNQFYLVTKIKKEFNPEGIEMKRTKVIKGIHKKKEDFVSTYIATRNDDLVTFVVENDEGEREEYIVSPDYLRAHELEPHMELSKLGKNEREYFIDFTQRTANFFIMKGLDKFLTKHYRGDGNIDGESR